MKYNKFVVVFVLLFAVGCKKRIPDSDIALWNKFPSEKFFSYSDNMELNNIVQFISENNERIQFSIDYAVANNIFLEIPPEQSTHRFSTGELLDFRIYDGISTENWTFFLSAEVYNRYFLLFHLQINLPDIKQDAQFYRETPYDENYMPYNSDEIATYLTDTINMYNRQGEYVAKLVAGKGLVSFTDENGVKWNVVE
ncbi:MAG: hypothetical protein LBS50_04805 [Prevotellaceae bacterium]|jgi:hypothetical protein|nr:hypothetical protein [Prevotellaceae bacterium]